MKIGKCSNTSSIVLIRFFILIFAKRLGEALNGDLRRSSLSISDLLFVSLLGMTFESEKKETVFKAFKKMKNVFSKDLLNID